MTRINITRTARKEGYTIGRLCIDGEYFCDTMEPRDSTFFGERFRLGHSAIPIGIYTLSMNIISPKFGKKMPRIIDCKESMNILIHQGNTPQDTQGCILVGRNTVKGQLTSSLRTFNRLKEILDKAETAKLIIN